ncbi:uncharacterized protein [Hyperolius riggenbachi]|uniref:uncharacterized protein n=1 Tax=Hyperolius riggenbachi TaxID=752182 RepID=UPI0035A31E4C
MEPENTAHVSAAQSRSSAVDGKKKDLLRNALKDISEDSLKSFKRKLCEQDKCEKIPLSKVEDKDAEAVVDVIIRHYTIRDGPGIVVKVLEDIKECQVSLDLRKDLERIAVNEGTENSLAFPNITSPQIASKEENDTSIPIKKPKLEKNDLKLNTAKEGASKSQPTAREPTLGKPWPKMKLKEVTPEAIRSMLEDSENIPQKYATLLFNYFVPLKTIQKWSKDTNFDGYNVEHAIPRNLVKNIMAEVRKEFPVLDKKTKKKIKVSINRRIKNPSKTSYRNPI